MIEPLSLETLAFKMLLTPQQAIALPSVVDRSAKMLGISREQMLRNCVGNPSVCEYLANICRQVTKRN